MTTKTAIPCPNCKTGYLASVDDSKSHGVIINRRVVPSIKRRRRCDNCDTLHTTHEILAAQLETIPPAMIGLSMDSDDLRGKIRQFIFRKLSK